MLQITLAPAPVPLGEIHERRRTFLVAARDFWREIHLPAGATQEGSFDEVMAQDVATKRGPSWEVWQPGMFDESLGTQDGIVPPIATLSPMPGGDTGGDNRAVEAGRKILRRRGQRRAGHHPEAGAEE